MFVFSLINSNGLTSFRYAKLELLVLLKTVVAWRIKMKRIQTRIMAIIFVIILVLCIIFGFSSSFLNYFTANDVLEQNLVQMSALAGEVIHGEMELVKQAAIEAGYIKELSDPLVSVSEKQAILQQRVDIYGFIGGNILDEKGTSVIDGKSFADRDYFQAAIKGEPFISGPLVSKITGEYSIMIAAPIWESGVPNSKIVGVIYFKPDLYILSEFVKTIAVGEKGGAYIIDKDGLVIAHQIQEMVCVQNVIELAQTDKSLEKMAKLEGKMIVGETGYGKYKYQGVDWVMGYSPIPETSWSIGVYANEGEFIGNVYRSIYITIFMSIVALVVGAIVAFILGKKIAHPIILCKERLELFTEGDLHSPIPVINSKDETKQLIDSLGIITQEISAVINDISVTMGEMANGNLDVDVSLDYKGDFIPIKTATIKIIDSFNDTLKQINLAADQVSEGSGQVAHGAQELAYGATEQAAAIEELAASIHEISEQIEKSAGNAKNAKEKAGESSAEVEGSSGKMQEMMAAMEQISEKSAEIAKIVKTIEDIAFQTNILALNATIEAARVGEAGQGFAVVADEVRNLAGKSADAAKNTTILINETVLAVNNGVMIAQSTETSMGGVVTTSQEISSYIDQISVTADQQSTAVEQVSKGVEQISGVVQSNSATAEESAAASEELSAQAQSLKELVSRFQLKE